MIISLGRIYFDSIFCDGLIIKVMRKHFFYFDLQILYITNRTGKSHQVTHILWKVFLPRRIQILRIVHGEYRYFMPMRIQQLFQIEHINTITATAVIKLVCSKIFIKNVFVKYKRLTTLLSQH